MKRLISILLAAIILLAPQSFAYANNNKSASSEMTKEELIFKLKKTFDIDDRFDDFSIDERKSEMGKSYSITWNNTKDNITIYASISSRGDILNYEKINNKENNKAFILPKYDYKEAKQKAEFKLKEILGSEFKNFKFLETSSAGLNRYTGQYNIFYKRYVDESLVREEGLRIAIDSTTGEIISYNLNLILGNYLDDTSSFQDKSGIISKEEAIDIYKEYNGLYLNLERIIDYSNKSIYPVIKYIPVYRSIENSIFIDAKKGEPKIDSQAVGFGAGFEEKSMDNAAEGGPSLSTVEKEELKKANVKIDVESAEKIARDILQISNKMKLVSSRLSKYNNDADKFAWTLRFSDDKSNFANLSLDANDGILLNINKSMENDIDDNKSIPLNESVKVAKDFIEKYAPDIKDSLEITPMSLIKQDGGFKDIRFVRKLNDKFYILEDGVSIVVRGNVPEVISFTRTWYDKIQVPAIKEIKLEEAYDKLFDKYDYELIYTANHEAKKYNLVYSLINPDGNFVIDAQTGQFLDRTGKPLSVKKSGYTDIDKAKDKKKIQLMSDYNIRYLESELDPTAGIKQRDMMLLIYSIDRGVFSDSLDYNEVYEYAINSKIIYEDEIDKDKVLDRRDVAKFIIRKKGLEDIAKLEHIFKDVYKDAPKDGYLILAGRLNLIEAKGDSILPNQKVDREEALMIIYNYIFED